MRDIFGRDVSMAIGELVADRMDVVRTSSFLQITTRAHRLAASLGDRLDATPKAPIVLAVSDPIEFAIAFSGIVLAGAVPVPAPGFRQLQDKHVRRLRQVVEATQTPLVIGCGDNEVSLRDALQDVPLPIETTEELRQSGPCDAETELSRADVAYIQFTSGSTGDPKPVPVTWRNLVAQLEQAAEAFDESPLSVSVNWVPLFHDMGLVTSLLRPMWSGYRSVVLDPLDFVRNPSCWPSALTRWKATHTSAPDFGYALCARKTTDVDAFDLRSLKVARNAGEMVRASTLTAFHERFRTAGFARRVFAPSYGLAEATLTVTTCPLDEEPSTICVDRQRLTADSAEVSEGENTVLLVSSGRPLRDTRIEILDPVRGDQLPDGAIGEVRIYGPQVVGGVVDTGDFGFVRGGELFLTGRSRERFQVAGSNYYSVEIESSLTASLAELRPGRTMVFYAEFAERFDSGLIVTAEVGHEGYLLQADLMARIRKSITSTLALYWGLRANRIELVPPGTLSVTTSGKLRRDQIRSTLC